MFDFNYELGEHNREMSVIFKFDSSDPQLLDLVDWVHEHRTYILMDDSVINDVYDKQLTTEWITVNSLYSKNYTHWFNALLHFNNATIGMIFLSKFNGQLYYLPSDIHDTARQ